MAKRYICGARATARVFAKRWRDFLAVELYPRRMDRSEHEFLVAMARRYCWDMPDPESGAVSSPERVVRRVMDLGIIEDAFALEPMLGRARLVSILQTSPAGAMRPRSWWFWHYRLGLADVTNDPPPMPARSFD